MRFDMPPNTPCGFCGKTLEYSLTGNIQHKDGTPICDSKTHYNVITNFEPVADPAQPAQNSKEK